MSERARFVFWGSSGHAKVLADVIASQGGSVLVLFDNDVSRPSCLPDVPIYHGETGLEQWLGSRPSGEISAAVAIGGDRGEDRQRIALYLLKRGLSIPLLVHPTASVSPSAKIGRGSQLLARAIVAADTVLGAVVTKDVPEFHIVAGNPARTIRRML